MNVVLNVAKKVQDSHDRRPMTSSGTNKFGSCVSSFSLAASGVNNSKERALEPHVCKTGRQNQKPQEPTSEHFDGFEVRRGQGQESDDN